MSRSSPESSALVSPIGPPQWQALAMASQALHLAAELRLGQFGSLRAPCYLQRRALDLQNHPRTYLLKGATWSLRGCFFLVFHPVKREPFWLKSPKQENQFVGFLGGSKRFEICFSQNVLLVMWPNPKKTKAKEKLKFDH